MIRAILVDDEPSNTRILEKMIDQFCSGITIVGKADNGKKALEVIRREKPDLVFLDIEMPYGNAFQLLDSLKPIEFEIIFVTAFDSYMLKAIRYCALDYLLKPVDINEVKAAVNRAFQRLAVKNANRLQLENLLNHLKNPNVSVEKMALPIKEGFVFQDIQDIMRCEAKGGYTIFHIHNGEKILACHNIKEYEDLLPETDFCRIHISHIVNLKFVRKYLKGRGGYIEMSDGTVLEVAIRRKEEILSRFRLRNL